MQPIYTQTVGAGGAATVTFNNVPQTFTDLYLVASVRGTASQLSVDCFCSFSGQTGTNHSQTRLIGSGSSAGSDRPTTGSGFRLVDAAGATSTSNTFSSAVFYLPNYISINNRSVITDGVMENNATTTYSILTAVSYLSSAAITSIRFDSSPGSFAQHSTFTLYGITKG